MNHARWRDACAAAALLAMDPRGLGGIVVRAAPGPVRDAWLRALRAVLPEQEPMRRMPPQIPDSRLLGGLDLAATLRTGRPVAERGLLAEAHGGIVVVPMAERMGAATAARLAATLDSGEVRVERDGIAQSWPAQIAVVALDEGLDGDEALTRGLLDRLGLWIDLEGIPISVADATPVDTAAADAFAIETASARAYLASRPVTTLPSSDEALEALCGVAHALGVDSPRAALAALRAARAAAALRASPVIEQEDCELAVRLVLIPRATRKPASVAEDPAVESSATDGAEQAQQAPHDSVARDSVARAGDASTRAEGDPLSPPAGDPQALAEQILAAVKAFLPAGLLEGLIPSVAPAGKQRGVGQQRSGRGAVRRDPLRGRPVGTQRGDPRRGNRLDLVATLRAAAPWQRVRRGDTSRGCIAVRTEDFRVLRREQRAATTTIFVVDASGSSALNRLAEAKGAIEYLLAECYVRRDRVALIAFRGQGADVLLPPTRSLVRARRTLSGLPGGGATPLAAGLQVAAKLADSVCRQGDSPLLVVLTDGRGNIGLDGEPGRERARVDALAVARQWRLQGLTALLVDTSPRAHPAAQELAQTMQARFLPLPYADAAVLSQAISVATQGAGLRVRAIDGGARGRPRP